jgi:hypothetical protein
LVAFDSWYSSLENLKLVRDLGWAWLTRLKSNRQVSLPAGQHQAVSALDIPPDGLVVHLRGYGMVKVFRTSDTAIECLLMLGAVFKLPYRQTEGLGQSLMDLLGADVRVPDYTTLCQRSAGLAVSLPTSRPDEAKHIVVDSAGLKVYGEGEWKVRQHGCSKRRSLRRIHRVGRKRWKQEAGYHRRSLAETAVFRFKIIFGNHLSARTMPRQITEARIKCAALNRMTHLGMPDSYRVA